VFGLVFVTTTRPEDFTFALRRLGLPGGMSVALSLAFRLLPSFLATVQTVKDAQRARGLDLDSGGLMTRLRRYLSLAAPVFGYALRQATTCRALWKHVDSWLLPGALSCVHLP